MEHEPAAGQRTFPTGAGPLLLERRPVDPSGQLQAWDAADRLLVDAAQTTSGPVLVVGDSFGALATTLRHRHPVGWSDSAVSHLATAANIARQADDGSATLVADPEVLVRDGRRYPLVLWRVPPAVRTLRHQASVIQAAAVDGGLVLAAGMDKYLPPDTRAVLDAMGAVQMHPGVRKAHLFEVRVAVDRLPLVAMDLPTVSVPEWELELQGGHASFSPERLDLGARVLAGALGGLRPVERVADLCCGGGVLGLVVQRHQPAAELHYFDESWSAVHTARGNVGRNVGPGAAAVDRFHWTDGMHAYDGPPFDAIVCNPPFHQRGAVTDAVAWQLFTEARANLSAGGELWVVGNRHLGYHVKLQRLFGNCRQVATHPKFVVLAATRR